MTRDTVDDYQRGDEQARNNIASMLDQNLFVDAGAGTGKTRALTDRYVAHVAAGLPVEKLVAITFTEKAAAELRERVRSEIDRRISEGEGDGTALTVARESLDRAQISTIHAFCSSVLRSFAASSGIDPSFVLQDEVQAERRFEVRWVSYLEKKADEPKALEAFEHILDLGLTTRDLQGLARALWGNPALAERLDAAPITPPAASWPDLTEMQRKIAELRLGHVPDDDTLRVYAEEMAGRIDEMLHADRSEREAILLAYAPSIKERLGQTGGKENWGHGVSREHARDTVKDIGSELRATLEAIRTEALGVLLPYVVEFATDDTRDRLRSGELVFDDLILQVRNILAQSEEARRVLRGRYSTMLIDEFQDTDPTQTEIARCFAVDPDTGRWDGGRLFLVGDPKQSIYRFRRADMVIYSDTRDELRRAGGHEEALALNRRSRDVVLDFVNDIFEELIGDGGEPRVQPAYVPVRPFRHDDLEGPGVALIGGRLENKAKDVRVIETGQIAAYCREAIDRGWQVQERDTGEVRAATFADIAILVPTRTILPPLERAMTAAGVPYRVESGSLVYGTQEVRDILNCLSAIDDPADEVAVAGALRSPAYGCSDVELAQHRLDRGSFNYLSPNITDASRVGRALLDLRAFHYRRAGMGIAALVERFVASHRVVEAGLYTSGNRDAFRRVRFIIEQARKFEAEQPESLRAFVEWLSRRAGDAIVDYEGAGLDDDEDAVRVLTIHAAKGLEFPIVFLAGLSISLSNISDTFMVNRMNGHVAVSAGFASRNNKMTVGDYGNVNSTEKAHQEAERRRLLYVAATRARDHLIVSLYHGKAARGTLAEVLINADIKDCAPQLEELPVVDGPAATSVGGLEVDAVSLTEEAFAVSREALIEGGRGQAVTSATGLSDDGEERHDETEPWARGRAGTHRGRAVHAALQVLPWDADDATIDTLAAAQAVAETIPGQEGEVASLLRRALATGAAARARTARRALREVPFALILDGVLLEGFIDLVIEAPDGSIEIVDWKTDAVPDAAVERRMENYRLQAGVYVLGIEAATGRSVSRVTYVFVSPGREVPAGDPAALAAAARERVRAHPASAG